MQNEQDKTHTTIHRHYVAARRCACDNSVSLQASGAAATSTANASNAEVVVTYAYDHRGRMVRKTISRGDAETRNIAYLWDGWNIIRETATGLSTFQPFNFSTDYVWGLDLDGTLQGAGGVGGLLAVIRDDGVFLPAYDANGNITEYVATNGAVAAHYEYSAFGEPTVSSGELASAFTHQFSTKPYCAVTGFSEYQMRKYRPDIGRWMSRDRIGEKGGANIFSFLHNSIINHVDILGNYGASPVFIIVKTPGPHDKLYDDYQLTSYLTPEMREKLGKPCCEKPDKATIKRKDILNSRILKLRISLTFKNNTYTDLSILWNSCFRTDGTVGYIPRCTNSFSCDITPSELGGIWGDSYFTMVEAFYLSCENKKWAFKRDSSAVSYRKKLNGWRPY